MDEATEPSADNDLFRPEDAVSVDLLLTLFDSSFFSLFGVENDGRLRSTSAGKSAMPIANSAMLPRSALAPPVTGSLGPYSRSYSRDI
jgi:hypothetical protein